MVGEAQVLGGGAAVKRRRLLASTHNTACSRMAEGLRRNLAGDRFEAYSTDLATTAADASI